VKVLNGEGYGVVVRCGDNTFIGKINALASQTQGKETTLQRDIRSFIKVIAYVAITMAAVLFSAGMGRKMKFEDAFVNGVVVVLVANIPQGLPATVTAALTLTAENMRNVNVLVKRTDIIEALGSATRIASDKTGALISTFHLYAHALRYGSPQGRAFFMFRFEYSAMHSLLFFRSCSEFSYSFLFPLFQSLNDGEAVWPVSE
jgi:sodium/potassium-transporting ATPase subunit alpha